MEALDGEYLDLHRTAGDLSSWYVSKVTSGARREVGQWPTGESLIERLEGGIAEAAAHEGDPERKRRLLALAHELGTWRRPSPSTSHRRYSNTGSRANHWPLGDQASPRKGLILKNPACFAKPMCEPAGRRSTDSPPSASQAAE